MEDWLGYFIVLGLGIILGMFGIPYWLSKPASDG